MKSKIIFSAILAPSAISKGGMQASSGRCRGHNVSELDFRSNNLGLSSDWGTMCHPWARHSTDYHSGSASLPRCIKGTKKYNAGGNTAMCSSRKYPSFPHRKSETKTYKEMYGV